MTDTASRFPTARSRPFNLLLKPHGPACNLACTYCFYLRKAEMFAPDDSLRMSDEVLDELTRQYIASQAGRDVVFAWQGGEPTLMGIPFYERALEMQRRYAPPGMHVFNALQTNGILLDDEWCRFLKRNGFLVGLSLDGPHDLHDANRIDHGGHGTFERVTRALRLLQAHGVEHNVLCLVNRVNAAHPREVYGFLKNAGVRFIQLIPGTEILAGGSMADWSVTPDLWGGFLCGVFDEWVRTDVGRVFVQAFDEALAAWTGARPGICSQAPVCGDCLVVEHNGDVYSCDHFVDPAHYLGNVMTTLLSTMAVSEAQLRFGCDKRDCLPQQCRDCASLFACGGGCPRERYAANAEITGGLSALCTGWKRFYTHISPAMTRMAALLDAGRPPAAIMATDRPVREVGRNDPCPCGSGRKYKHCCMRR